MERAFNYIDTLDELNSFVQERGMTKEELARSCDGLIEGHHNMICLIRSFVADSKKQIKEWKDVMTGDRSKDYSGEIEMVRTIIDFYELNGRYALLELDVNTAYKHLILAQTEYDYRFFARRVYTLMYEARKGLAIPTGQMYKRLESIVEPRNMEPYKREHSTLTDFLNRSENELKNIRNTNEAHKFMDFNDQVVSIEKMSVARSIELIQAFCSCLATIYCAFMVVQGALTSYVRRTITES